MSHYLIPRDPTRPYLSIKTLREQVRPKGYLIEHHRHTRTFTLVDSRLGQPVMGFHDVGLPKIGDAVEIIRHAKRPRRNSRRTHHSIPQLIRTLDQILDREASHHG